MFVCDVCSHYVCILGCKPKHYTAVDEKTLSVACIKPWFLNHQPVWHGTSILLRSSLTCQVFVREKGSNCVLQVRDQLLPQRVHVTWIPDFLQGNDVVQRINQYDNKGRVIWEYWVNELLFCKLLWHVVASVLMYQPLWTQGRKVYVFGFLHYGSEWQVSEHQWETDQTSRLMYTY